MKVRVAALGARLDKLIAGDSAYPPNRRLLDHLARERDAIFTCLTRDGVQATNWRAEQAIRPAVVNRKTWGDNRHLERRRDPATAVVAADHRPTAAA